METARLSNQILQQSGCMISIVIGEGNRMSGARAASKQPVKQASNLSMVALVRGSISLWRFTSPSSHSDACMALEGIEFGFHDLTAFF